MLRPFATDAQAGETQEVTPSPEKSRQDDALRSSTTATDTIDPLDVRKQIRAGAQATTPAKIIDAVAAADPNFEATTSHIREQQEVLNRASEITSELRKGHVTTRENMQGEIAAYEASWSKYNPWSGQFYQRELIEQKKRDLKVHDTFAESLKAQEKELNTTLQQSQNALAAAVSSFKESQELGKEVSRSLERARELTAANKEQEARTETKKAEELVARSLERLEEARKLQQQASRLLPQLEQPDSLPESAAEQYQHSVRASTVESDATAGELKKTQGYIRMARDSTIIIGATVATGGLAAVGVAGSYSVAAVGAVSIGGGTAAGTGIGLASTAAEQGRSIVEGQKTTTAGLKDGLHQTVHDAQLALTSAVGNYSGFALLSHLAPKVAILLGGSRVAVTTSKIASGSAATVPPTLLQEGLDVTINGKEFSGLGELGDKITRNAITGGLKTALSVLGDAARFAWPFSKKT